jgi:hypothetical protein
VLQSIFNGKPFFIRDLAVNEDKLLICSTKPNRKIRFILVNGWQNCQSLIKYIQFIPLLDPKNSITYLLIHIVMSGKWEAF